MPTAADAGAEEHSNHCTQTLGLLRKPRCIPINGWREMQIEVLDCGPLVGVLRGTPYGGANGDRTHHHKSR